MKIYYVYLNGVDIADVERYIHLIPRDRQERTARYRTGRDRLLSLAAGLLIQLAGKQTIAYSEHGKPYFVDGDIHFSLSHSGACCAIAFSNSEVGLDVEEIGRKVDPRMISRFHPAEQACIERAEDPARTFIEVWTRKEAYVKYTGSGIAVDLSSFDVTSPPLGDMIRTRSSDHYFMSICSADDHEVETQYVSLEELLENARKLQTE